jgi:hypothetical protein
VDFVVVADKSLGMPHKPHLSSGGLEKAQTWQVQWEAAGWVRMLCRSGDDDDDDDDVSLSLSSIPLGS